jgi:hypothetical protein
MLQQGQACKYILDAVVGAVNGTCVFVTGPTNNLMASECDELW